MTSKWKGPGSNPGEGIGTVDCWHLRSWWQECPSGRMEAGVVARQSIAVAELAAQSGSGSHSHRGVREAGSNGWVVTCSQNLPTYVIASLHGGGSWRANQTVNPVYKRGMKVWRLTTSIPDPGRRQDDREGEWSRSCRKSTFFIFFFIILLLYIYIYYIVIILYCLFSSN